MKRTLKLDFPLKVNGTEITELDYDFTKITVEHFMQASMKSADMTKAQALNLKMKENDYALHMYLGCMAVIAENPSIAIEDLERVHGSDVIKLVNIGMLFTYGRLGGISEESSSDELSEIIAETSTQAQQTSDECTSENS